MRATALATALAIALAIALAPAAAFAASLGVPLDQSIRLALPAPAADVIVGNPAIAEVQIADQRHVVVTGKAGGVTNLIITDVAGRTIFNRQLVVSGSSADHVSLINGAQVVSYACAPGCAPVGGAQQGAADAAGPAFPMSAPAANTGAPAASPGMP
ncbi:MAG TPA: pilus assembly protein N-terminal domain-containing protein [Caulobacteraceae bacterium]|nr:pilus assembly protein N-terminal domain-containing protein [Caulobacteraceae bacterium]